MIFVFECSLEAIAIRSCLEYWGMHIEMYYIGQPKDFVQIVNNRVKQDHYILLVGHGNDKGFLLPELSSELNPSQPFTGCITPADVRDHLSFKNNVVISTACMTGNTEMADAFLEVGASIYIGPDGYPDGDSALYYMLSLYYSLHHTGLSIKQSHSVARSPDKETALFRMYS